MIAKIRQWTPEVASLAVLSALAIFIRHYGDRADQYLTAPYLVSRYGDFVRNELTTLPFWKLFLPLQQIKGTWSTTGFLLNYFLESRLGPVPAHYVLVISSSVAFYALIRYALGSRMVALVGASFLLFSRYNLHIYIAPGSNNTYNLTLFASLSGIVGLRIWRHGVSPLRAVLFVLTLIAMAMCYEAWVNVAIAALWIWLAVAVFLWRSGQPGLQPRLAFMGLATFAIMIAYVAIRAQYSHLTFRDGTEAQLLHVHLNRREFSVILDDLLNNVMLNFFMTVTQIFPPGFGHSTHVLNSSGTLDVVAITSGYLKSISNDIDWMMKAHYWTIWRFWAGGLVVAALFLACKWAKKAWFEFDSGALVKLCLIVPVLLGSPSHSMLKVVHWTTWPHTPYKVSAPFLFLLGLMCVLLSETFAHIARSTVRQVIGGALIAYSIICFLVVPRVYNAHIRFAWGEKGLFHQGFYPDAITGLKGFARNNICPTVGVYCRRQ